MLPLEGMLFLELDITDTIKHDVDVLLGAIPFTFHELFLVCASGGELGLEWQWT